jgi:hypothetical protein
MANCPALIVYEPGGVAPALGTGSPRTAAVAGMRVVVAAHAAVKANASLTNRALILFAASIGAVIPSMKLIEIRENSSNYLIRNKFRRSCTILDAAGTIGYCSRLSDSRQGA